MHPETTIGNWDGHDGLISMAATLCLMANLCSAHARTHTCLYAAHYTVLTVQVSKQPAWRKLPGKRGKTGA
eukprot:5181489-Amphidinium_carterae.1